MDMDHVVAAVGGRGQADGEAVRGDNHDVRRRARSVRGLRPDVLPGVVCIHGVRRTRRSAMLWAPSLRSAPLPERR